MRSAARVCAVTTNGQWANLEGDADRGGFGMQTGSAAPVGGWFSGFRSRPVVLLSPHPVSECLRRLTVATTERELSRWHLYPDNARLGAPRFRGSVSPSRILVARCEDAVGRASFAPWLEGRLDASASGGTMITGSIGLHPTKRAAIPVVAAVAGLIGLGALAAAFGFPSGHISRSLPAVLMPFAMIALMVAVNIKGLRTLEQNIPKLVQEMNATLGSSAVSPDPGAVQGAGNDA
jgi:hypothetical protein